jgi:hypothetical protein
MRLAEIQSPRRSATEYSFNVSSASPTPWTRVDRRGSDLVPPFSGYLRQFFIVEEHRVMRVSILESLKAFADLAGLPSEGVGYMTACLICKNVGKL